MLENPTAVLASQDRGFGLRATGMGRVPASLGGRQFRFHLVEFLRADRLLVVKHLVALHGRSASE